MKRLLQSCWLIALAILLTACANKKVHNPIANVDSKQPDKVLFDRAMTAMKQNRFDVARMSLQTLINTYPDSEYIARAKLAIGDSWLAEGGATGLAQAEAEYRDFETFFPNMPEAAEAQMKIARIEYQQMEKPDRDPTHARRAEDEYRKVMQTYPDSKLAPEAKQRLLEVQEVLAEREYAIGHFYYLREAWAASIARLKSMVDTYPLYSGADEALFEIGDAYQKQAERVNLTKFPQDTKARMIGSFEDRATEAYARILTRYPVSDRADEAAKRLAAMKRPVPKATPEALAQNKAERDSRSHTGLWGRTLNNFERHPDIALAPKIGEPTMVDPRETSAQEVVRSATQPAVESGGSHSVSIEKISTGAPSAGEPGNAAPAGFTPSEAAPAAPPANSNSIGELGPANSSSSSTSGTNSAAANSGNADGGSASTSSSAENDKPAPAPPQINDAAQTPTGAAEKNDSGTKSETPAPAATGNSGTQTKADASQSTSRKKKKGWRRILSL